MRQRRTALLKLNESSIIRNETVEVKGGHVDRADLKVTADSRTWLGFVAKERSLVWGLASAKDPVQGIATIAARLR